MVAVYSDLLEGELPILANNNLGGIIAMDAISSAQVQSITDAVPDAPFIAVDQEGGTVQRYKQEGILPGAYDMTQGFTVDQAYTKYFADNMYLKGVGITTNFAPVVDVLSGTYNPLPGRLYSSVPDEVVDYARASVRAAQAAGITPVVKHFPGLGSASGNTDFGSTTTDSIDVLKTRDLVPYRSLSSLHPDAMVGNMIVPGLTDGQPAVWSADAVSLLRSLGYEQAVIYTDSLTAQAVPGAIGDAVVKAWQAGIDVAVVVQTKDQTANLSQTVDEITTVARNTLSQGVLSKRQLVESNLRIFARKNINPCNL
jgi:beta-N-acetylhexosaminidase